MTTQKLYTDFSEFINSLNIVEFFEKKLEKAIQSNALNITDEPEHSTQLPQVITYAALCELADQLKPKDPRRLMDSENLQRFL